MLCCIHPGSVAASDIENRKLLLDWRRSLGLGGVQSSMHPAHSPPNVPASQLDGRCVLVQPQFPSPHTGQLISTPLFRKSTPLPHRLPVEVEPKHPKDTHHTAPSQQTHATRYTAQAVEHRRGEEHGTGSEETPRTPISREQRAHIPRVCKGQVDEHALRDDEDAAHADSYPGHTDYPVNGLPRGPS